MEGFGGVFVESLGGVPDVSPNLERLSRKEFSLPTATPTVSAPTEAQSVPSAVTRAPHCFRHEISG